MSIDVLPTTTAAVVISALGGYVGSFVIPVDLIVAIIGGTLTAIGGYFATLLSTRLTRQKELEQRTLEEALAVNRTKADEVKAELVKAIISKVPEGLPPAEVKEALKSQLAITGDVYVSQISKSGVDFIENLVNGYHQQALSQARVQFWFSVIAATVGFVYILLSAYRFPIDQASGVVKILPGVVIDAVAALFFRQAEQTRQRATELYDRLRSDSQLAASERLLQSIDDVRIRSFAQAQIALHMAGLKPREIDIASLLPGGKPSTYQLSEQDEL